MSFEWAFREGKIYFVFEVLIAALMFVFRAPRRKLFPVRAILSVVVLVLISGFFPVMNGVARTELPNIFFQFFSFLFLFLCVFLALYICFDVKALSMLSICAEGYAIQHLAYHLSGILKNTTFLEDSMDSSVRSRLFEVIFMVIVFVLVYFISARKNKEYDRYSRVDSRYTIISITVIFICVVITRFASYFDAYGTIIDIYASTCCVLALFIYNLLHSTIQLETEKAIIQKIQEDEARQYEISKRSSDLVNIKFHDLKHRLDNEAITDEEKEDIRQALNEYDSIIKTGNDVLNAVLTEKKLTCIHKNINMTFMGDASSISFMKKMDIYSLFGNAIDNAIEASGKLDNPEKKTISISLERKESFIVLTIKNYFDGKIIDTGDELKTTKSEESGYHGFGMKSMKLIAEKYGGDMSYLIDNDIFTLNIYLFTDQEAKN